MMTGKLSLVFMISLMSLAAAAYADSSDSSNGFRGHRGPPPPMTDAQKACFTDNGLTAPGEGERPATRPDRSVMEKVHTCLEANGFKMPPHPPRDGAQGGADDRGPSSVNGGGSEESGDSESSGNGGSAA